MCTVCMYVCGNAGPWIAVYLFPVEKMGAAYIEVVETQQHVILPFSGQQSAPKQ